MNITTYRNYTQTWKGNRKSLPEIKQQLIESINSCENESQIAAVTSFHTGYLAAFEYEKSVRYKEVTDRMMKTFFTKYKKGVIRK